MILKNSKGIERNFEVLIELEKDNKKFVIYKDIMSDSIYSGREEDNKLFPLTDEEFAYVNSILEKING